MKELKSERIMKNVMKTIMRNTKLVMILAFLPALFGAAQVGAVDYKSTYKSPYDYGMQTQSPAPSMDFHSTSVLPASGSAYTATPMIGENGAAATPSYAAPGRIGHIRKLDANGNGIEDDEEGGEEPGNAGTPGQTVDPKDQLPLGDAVWPLMLMALAYLGVRVFRARKRA